MCQKNKSIICVRKINVYDGIVNIGEDLNFQITF